MTAVTAAPREPRYVEVMYTVERLLRVSRGEESARSTIEYPLEHLVACHGRIEERLGVLERAGEHLETRPREALEAIASSFRYFESSGAMHTADEEQSVFPRLRPRLNAAETAAIEALEREHREADAAYAALKAVAVRLQSGPAPQACAEYRAAVARLAAIYRPHIERENRELIAAARRVLSDEDLAAISREMKLRRQDAAAPAP